MSTTSRRALLGAIAAAPALAAVPALASSTEPDPIFAIIEAHRMAYDGLESAMDLVAEACRHFNCDDHAPEVASWVEVQDAMGDRMSRAGQLLAETEPTSMAGVLAIMAYRRELQNGDAGGYDLFPMRGDGNPDNHDDITDWLATIERSLTKIAGEVAS